MSNITTLLHPELLWLALVLVPLIFLAALRLRGLAAWRRNLAMLFQSASVFLLLVALAEPVILKPDTGLSLVVVLDASSSLSEQSRQQAAKYANDILASATPNQEVNFVATGRQAIRLTNDEILNNSWLEPSTEQIENPNSKIENSTDLAAGLRLAGSLLDETGMRRVVLVTDGWETRGRAADEASRLSARSIDVQVVALPALGEPEVVVQYVSTTPYVRVGDYLQSDVSVFSTVETSATLRVSIDGGEPSSREVLLRRGENQIPLEQRAEVSGFHRIDVEVDTPSDTAEENNSASVTLVVKQEPRVLILEDRPGEAQSLSDALEGQQMSVDVRAPATIPAQLGELAGYDAIIMNNVAATSMTLDQQKTIQEYVRRNGRGLVVVGGETSYSRGGYLDSVFEEMLPVSSDPAPRPEQGATALMLVLDRSGSMSLHEGTGPASLIQKSDMAKEAARLAVDALREGDSLGVLAFDDINWWIVPVQTIRGQADKDHAKSLISELEMGGGTNIYPAVKEGAEALRSVLTRNKHMVLLTDGQEERPPDYGPLLEQIRSEGVSLSAIAIGQSADRELLTRLAKLGQGRYYFTEQPANIPKIVFKELNLALKEATIVGRVQPHFQAPSPVLRGFAPQDLRQLSGYNITTAKDQAVMALVSDQNDPLMAHWNYGLGRVAAFTSDANSLWAADWLLWEDFGRFWSGVVRWTMASPVSRQLQPSITVVEQGDQDVAVLSVESLNADNSFANLTDLTAALRSPSGAVTNVAMSQAAPGRYEARIPLAEKGAYEVRLSRGGDQPAIETAGFSVPPSAEFLHAGTNDRLLKQLNGGKAFLTQPQQALGTTTLQGESPDREPLWPYYLAPAL
ncbi:MAG TPA: VWA domain-containing protein, partial [Chloroflexia bacterium]|nr:VWA domain-containing protein [Chloroflexia bacterium]